MIFYVDLYRLFLDGSTLDRSLTYDGRHLNGEGYARWKQAIEPYVERVQTTTARTQYPEQSDLGLAK